MANVLRAITEKGEVLEKVFKEATGEFKGSDGRVIAAQPDRYILRVVSGESVTKENGWKSALVQDYKVDKSTFEKAGLHTAVVVTYDFSSYGPKPISCELAN